ncbi:AAA family ATPase [Pseudomonas syringae]
MINFPILKKLSIENYGLYPGTNANPGLTIDFRKQGLSLIVGANGLGKSTLINIILRVLTGPSDLNKFERTDELGNLKLVAADRLDLRDLFSARVQDQALNATATLVVKFGDVEVTIVRSLHNLSLIDLKEGLSPVQLSSKFNEREDKFKTVICQAARLGDFGDWLLILHYVVFYQEERRALVWDTSAQREILRILLLSAEESLDWKLKARKALEADSEFRNLRSSINKQIKKIKSEMSSVEDRAGLRSELDALRKVKEETQNKLKLVDDNVDVKNNVRVKLREQLLLAKADLDGKNRDFENAKLLALESTLPTLSDTTKFIITQLMADDVCLACGSESPSTKADYQHRLENGVCVICGTQKTCKEAEFEPIEIANRRIYKLAGDIKTNKDTVEELNANLDRVEQEVLSWSVQVQEYRDVIRETTLKIAPIEAFIAKREEPTTKGDIQISGLKSMLDDCAKDLAEKHYEFVSFLNTVEYKFLEKTNTIQAEFNRIVQKFLVEDCEVSWKRVDWKLGQEEKPVEFPAYIFKMRSGTHNVITERKDPAEVSESQREFIDLAFRIALIQTAGNDGCGSIVMDAPESSLDAVFVERAANVFTEFSRVPGNKLLLASNLVDGNLLPILLAEIYRTDTLRSALVDLFSIGVPSRAVVKFKDSYKEHFKQVHNKAKEIANADS